MQNRKTLISIAVSTMALAAIVGVACTNEIPPPEDIEPASDTTGSETSASIGIPAPGSEGRVDEMIVVHGVPDFDPNESDGVPVLVEDGQTVEGVGPVEVVVRELPDGQLIPAEEHEISNPLPVAEPTSNTGAVSSINLDTCEGTLEPPPPTFALSTRSATVYANADNPAVVTMCTASYASVSGADFLTTTIISMSDSDAADVQYKTMLDSFMEISLPYEEKRNTGGDVLTVVADDGGIGRMITIRSGSHLVSVHNGPTSDASPWNEHIMLEIAHSILERVQRA